VISVLNTAGVSQYDIEEFGFQNLIAIRSRTACVFGTAIGQELRFAPGRLGTTKGNNVATVNQREVPGAETTAP
jgi:hypothetical protein